MESHDPPSLVASRQSLVQTDYSGPISRYICSSVHQGQVSCMMSVNVITSVNTYITWISCISQVLSNSIVATITINGIRLFGDPPVVGKSGEDSKWT